MKVIRNFSVESEKVRKILQGLIICNSLSVQSIRPTDRTFISYFLSDGNGETEPCNTDSSESALYFIERVHSNRGQIDCVSVVYAQRLKEAGCQHGLVAHAASG
jgi:hypothetical protein